MISRRHFLGASGAAAAAAGLTPGRAARASTVSAADRKFIFVVNYGGWDPTRVFATEFDNPAVDMERYAEAGMEGDLLYVAHDDRPSVTEFMQRNAEQVLLVNGILVPSIAHENCLRLSMTGTTATTRSDWPAMIADAASAEYPLPHMVIAGPSFPGALGGVVTRTGSSGQLQGLLSGDIISWSDTPTEGPGWRAEDVMDRYMARRFSAAADGARVARDQALLGALERSHERAQTLKDLLNVMDWSGGTSFANQLKMATDALALGISRCATLSFSYYGWDTHTQNDLYQSMNFEMLFGGLNDLMDALRVTPGTAGGSLADETVVMVLSEMGRTPQLNGSDGKDHWPYTSAMLVGPGVTGGRSIGGLDSYAYGKLIDFDTGEVDADNGRNLSVDSLGATVLTLAGVDPEEFMPGVPAVTGVLT